MKIILNVITGSPVPSFKNRKRIGRNRRSGAAVLFTDPEIKRRCQELEDAMLSALCSWCATGTDAMAGGCRRAQQIALCERLSGLSDDSLNQMPEGSFGVEYVTEDQQGVRIEIERLEEMPGATPGMTRETRVPPNP